MKFFRSRPFSGGDLQAVVKYIRVDLAKTLSDLVEGLRHLTLRENFDSFEAEVVLGSGETATITNRLGSKTLKWWPVRLTGDSRLVEGDGGITEKHVYIKNAGTTTTRATIVFMR